MKPPPVKSRRPLPPEDSVAPVPAERVASTIEKSHGRIEKRSIQTTSILTLPQSWKGLRQAFKIVRERTVHGVPKTETVYGITSLDCEKADAAQLLEIVRDHWLIENRLHYVRDVTLREDGCRVRSGSAPQVLAGLRNVLVHLLPEVGAENAPEAIEILQLNPEQAKKLIGIPCSE